MVAGRIVFSGLSIYFVSFARLARAVTARVGYAG